MKSNFIFIGRRKERREKERERERERERRRDRKKSIIYLKDTASKIILNLDVCTLNCKKIPQNINKVSSKCIANNFITQ